jgi:hypothetical protein
MCSKNKFYYKYIELIFFFNFFQLFWYTNIKKFNIFLSKKYFNKVLCIIICSDTFFIFLGETNTLTGPINYRDKNFYENLLSIQNTILYITNKKNSIFIKKISSTLLTYLYSMTRYYTGISHIKNFIFFNNLA